MSVFYLLPSRTRIGDDFAAYLHGYFPGLDWDAQTRPNLAEALVAAATCHPDVYVVFRDEVPPGTGVVEALVDGYGAEEGDEVIEVRITGRPGQTASWRWQVRKAA
jgi:hypothetical protein